MQQRVFLEEVLEQGRGEEEVKKLQFYWKKIFVTIEIKTELICLQEKTSAVFSRITNIAKSANGKHFSRCLDIEIILLWWNSTGTKE